MKYLIILFLFFCELSFGQIPGNPTIFSTRDFPTPYTLTAKTSADLSSVTVTAQVINTGTNSITTTGILWGTTTPTITDFYGKTTNGNILGQPFTASATPLPEEGRNIYFVAYATTAAGTFYGKTLSVIQPVVRSPFTLQTWMSTNLGATSFPVTPQNNADSGSFGHLYQWGRRADGHQIVLPINGASYIGGVAQYAVGNSFFSATTSTLASTYTNTTSSFIAGSNSNISDWQSTPRIDLWQGLNGLNNPCPTGFRLPTETEFTNETNNFSSQNSDGAFNSFLVLPKTGYRQSRIGHSYNQFIYFDYSTGNYWTSSTGGLSLPRAIRFTGSTLAGTQFVSAQGLAVRCIRGEPTSGGTAIISGYIANSPTGDMVASVPVSNVSQTINVNVTTAGSYNIVTSTTNGVTFSGRGTLASGDNQIITLTASGTPIVGAPSSSPYTFNLSTTPSYTFTRTVSGISTNGTSEIDSYTSKSSNGLMFAETAINPGEVSQTITANVTNPGTYSLKAISNGVTFSASGTFTTTGVQDIVLSATGTPTSVLLQRDITFTTNTTPAGTFTNMILPKGGDYTTNGTAFVTSYSLVQPDDQYFMNTPYVGVTQNFSANVGRVGTYSITTNKLSNLTFKGNGTFSSLGINYFTLSATGTPTTVKAPADFNFNTTDTYFTFYKYIFYASTNGTANTSTISSTGTNGSLLTSIAPTSTETQSITTNVSITGTWNITTNTNNGITFSGSGNHTAGGSGKIITLTASGTPISAGTYSFTTNTTPAATFNRTVNEGSSGGTAQITWNGIDQSTLTAAQVTENNRQLVYGSTAQSSSHKHYIVVNVTQAGSYNISAMSNRYPDGGQTSSLTLSGSGTLSTTGLQTITLSYTGTPSLGTKGVGHYFFLPNSNFSSNVYVIRYVQP